MDDSVLASMARWPDVPDVHGWLSLSEQGQWRLHPGGDAWRPGQPCPRPLPPGEPIESAQMRGFIDRNYGCDETGRWHFQNGPQRVFVRLDAAPYILHTGNTPAALDTHNGLLAERIDGWWLDDTGRLYAVTAHGPGLVSGRDAPSVFDALRTLDGEPLLRVLESLDPSNPSAQPALRLRATSAAAHEPSKGVPLRLCPASELAGRLGFVPCPMP